MRNFELEYKGKTYICELNRNVLRMLEERHDLNLGDGKPMTTIGLLFYGSLLKHQPEVSKKFALDMLDELTTPDEKNESLYDLNEIGEVLVELAKPCYTSEGVKIKNSIRK